MPNSESSAQSAHARRQQPSRKVFDVMRPGRAPASATSRPVIVGHKPQVHDPMTNKQVHVVDDAANALHVPDEPLLMAHNPNAMNAALPPVPLAPSASVAVGVSDNVEPLQAVESDGGEPLSAPTMQHFTPVEPTVPEPTAPSAVAEVLPVQQGDVPETAAVSEPTAQPRDAAFDNEAKTDLAALAVDDVTEIEDQSAQPNAPMQSDQLTQQTAVDTFADDDTQTASANTSQSTDDVGQLLADSGVDVPSQQPAKTYHTPLPKLDENEGDIMPSAADMGHVANSDFSAAQSQEQIEQQTQPVVKSGKSRHVGAWVFSLLLLLIIAAVVLDLLLDGGFIVLKHVPHTHFF